MNRSDTIGELAKALATAQGEMTTASKSADNPFFKSKYSDLASCWDACRNALSKQGLAVIQTTRPGEGKEIIIETMLAHSSGEWISSDLPMTPVKNDPQGTGSAITYGRRYALMGIVGIAPADDDGEAAMGRGEKKNSGTVNQHDYFAKKLKKANSAKDLSVIRVELEAVGDAKLKASIWPHMSARMKAVRAEWDKSKGDFVDKNHHDEQYYREAIDKCATKAQGAELLADLEANPTITGETETELHAFIKERVEMLDK